MQTLLSSPPTFLLLLVLLLIAPSVPNFTVGNGVGVGVGVGGAGGGAIWIGGGGGNGSVDDVPTDPQNPTPSSTPSAPELSKAYTALQTWKSAITEDPSKVLSSWVGPNVCSYKGVFCTDPELENDGDLFSFPVVGTGPFVSAIDLNHANIRGTLVEELSLLSGLSLLHLNSNRFAGPIPDSFKELTSLTELDLSNNQFSGPFPVSTLLIPNLIYLDLRFNSFSGTIPDELFNKRLDAIFLNNNQFEGELPQNLGYSPASVINLANNRLSGAIPVSLGYTNTALKEILFLNNLLSGCIPEGVGLFLDIRVLDVSFNSLMGHVPDSISCLEDIEVLNLGHNELSGELPDVVCSLESLVNLTVSYNFFSGFSQECAKLLLRRLGSDFSLNCIPGKDLQRPQPDCSSIPGADLSCLRVPSAKPFMCSSLLGFLATGSSSSP